MNMHEAFEQKYNARAGAPPKNPHFLPHRSIVTVEVPF